jgi:putative ABC transport system permease protein
METLWQDIRYGARLLIRRPAFTAIAVVTLALGIGANTAVFSVVNAVLFRSLPYEAADRLVFVSEAINKEPRPVAYPNYLDWRAEQTTFDDLAAYSLTEFTLVGNSRAERIMGEVVTGNYISLLGVRPALGRDFSPEETRTPLTHPVAIISHACWQSRFGSDPGLVGGTIKLNEVAFTVIGIMPEDFKGFSGAAEVWAPVMMRDALWPQTAKYDFLGNRDIHWHRVIGRLKPGVTLQSAQSEMEAIAARLEQSYPKDNANRGALVTGARERLVGEARPALLVLFAAVAFVLLIACANVASLVLARAATRQREIAVRVALGAGRGRIIKQLLTESAILSMAGGAAGLLVATWTMDLLVSILPIELPRFAAVGIDGGVLLFTLAVSLLTGLALGVAPALEGSKPDLNETLKDGSRSAGTIRGQRIRSGIVVAEIALALVLMIGAGLMLKSFRHMQEVDTGFKPEGLLTMRFDVPASVKGDERVRFGERVIERASGLAAVERAAITYTDMFLWHGISRGFTIEGGEPRPAGDSDSVYFQDISSNFFATMGVPILSGRDFSTSDDRSAPRVAVVSEAFARRYWPKDEAVGKRFKYGPADSKAPWITVVGIAGNIKFKDLRHDPINDPVVYVPLLQSEVVISLTLVARTTVDPASVASQLRAEIQKIDPEIPVYSVSTIMDRLAAQTSETRSYALLIGSFAVLAMFLSVVGIYGVMSYTVAERTREIGVRMALGAGSANVLRLVVGRGMRLASLGVALGLAGAYALTRLMSSLLFDVTSTDPFTFALAAAIFVAVALAANVIPARRAARLDPMEALRHE